MIEAWIGSLIEGKQCMDYGSMMKVSLATILVIESQTIGQPIAVDLSILS